MKLNLNCVRDTLFYLEENLSINEDLEINDVDLYELNNHLNHSIQEIANVLLVISEAGFIETCTDMCSNQYTDICVYRITYDGYQFIESIRPDTVWDKVKSVGSKVGVLTFDMITTIASNVITSMIE